MTNDKALAIKRKGINYDIGTYTRGKEASSREIFDPAVVKREMEIIKNDLHCTSIRISGKDIGRLTTAARFALEQGLEVWLSPAYVDADENDTIEYFSECAKSAEMLRTQYDNIIFVAGCELTFFMKGLILGDTAFDRINTVMKPWKLLKSTILKGPFNRRLNAFLARATSVIRKDFQGKLTYASGTWENVDWSLFDFVGVDYYREKQNSQLYREKLREYFKHGKPVIITEFGCCTYKGAEDKGGYGWAIVDRSTIPYRLKGDFVRSEEIQAKLITDLLEIFSEERVDGAFVFTFINQSYPYNENPLFDLDMAAYGVVKSYTDKNGASYKDMPWEPKQSFYSLAEYYGTETEEHSKC